VAGFLRSILCPIDFDDNAIEALEYARNLAKESGATLYIMHVVPAPPASAGFPLEAYAPISEGPSRLELLEIAREHVGAQARYELVNRSGKAAETIIRAAEEFDADLIVMATHGRTGIPRLFLGSVAEEVVRGSKRPVLTLRPEEARA
jgi:nucleotide-binding universal stress UspA family protein